MIRNNKAERRQYPRLEQELPFRVAANGYDFSTSTLNVSCVGAYCHINKYIPPFTKVMVKLALPVSASKGNKNYNAECKGVIVRSEDSDKGGFNIAIFFNDIGDSQRQKISQYINRFLPKIPVAVKSCGNLRAK
ncbi:MAG: PilZ domain-containing protein [Candidatus Omnitrophota bacterium]